MWLALSTLWACSGDDALTGEKGPCDPLDPAMCLLPYPSSFFLEEAFDTSTGYRMAFQPESMPVTDDGIALDPALWNEKDGFSTVTPMLADLGDVSLDGAVGHDAIERYADADAMSVIVDATTGERVPHWVELDVNGHDGEHLLILQPAVPLEHAHRYVVGLRGFQLAAGGAVAPSEAFQALRDDQETDDYDVEFRRQRFDDEVFPVLEDQGFARGDLQLAWDFVTASRENTLGRMEAIREDGLARIGPNGPAYTITGVEDEDCSAGAVIARTITGTMNVPLYTETDAPGTLLTRDDAGMPYANGTTNPEFVVRIPCSVATDPKPSRVLQYGHGLLGDLGEAYTGWLAEFANENRYVVVATTWTGMSSADAPEIILAMGGDPAHFASIPERSHQGFFEFMAALRMVEGSFAQDDQVKFPDAAGDLVSVVDPEKVSYYGNSQGSVLGGAYVAMSPDLSQGVLGVPGAPYSLLLMRSHDFTPFYALLQSNFYDQRDILLLISLFEQLWEPAEAAGWAHDMNRDAQEGIPPKQVLLQAALGDAQVTTLGAEYLARAYGASLVTPAYQPVYGLDERDGGFSGSALVEWHYTDVADMPYEDVPPDDVNDPHECPRREPNAQAQIVDFFEQGTVEQTCDGVCEDVRANICG